MSRFSRALYASLMVDVASLPTVYAEDPAEGERIRAAVERELRMLPPNRSSLASADAIVETIRRALQATDELPPSEADAVCSAVVAHVRARRPASVSPLGTLPPCTTPIRDPRKSEGER